MFSTLIPGMAHLQLTLEGLRVQDPVPMGHSVLLLLQQESWVASLTSCRRKAHPFTLSLLTIDKPCLHAISGLPGASIYVCTCLCCWVVKVLVAQGLRMLRTWALHHYHFLVWMLSRAGISSEKQDKIVCIGFLQLLCQVTNKI